MNPKILQDKIQDYISEHTHDDVGQIALKGSPFQEVHISELIEQIQSRAKSKKKLPSWYNTKHIYYPKTIQIEQTSSEESAKYKSQLVGGHLLVDLTGGFGVDSFYFSKQIKQVIHCEISPELSTIAKHNFNSFKIDNIETITGDGLEIIQSKNLQLDWIYIDPSRRDSSNNKRFFIEDCSPDVSKHLNTFFEYCNNILIKLSPMLDLRAALEVLPNTKEIHVVAIKNEVKEVLFVLEQNFTNTPKLVASNLKTSQANFEFYLDEEQNSRPNFTAPLSYLYEPNAAILKTGGFKCTATRFDISKLDQHTHLYTSAEYIEDFPGKIYNILKVLPYQKKELKRQLSGIKPSIKIRHFPKSVEAIKTELKLKDGDDLTLLFTTIENKKIVLFLEKS